MRAVIFDMDGVLTDSEPLINAAAARNLPAGVPTRLHRSGKTGRLLHPFRQISPLRY